MAIQLIVGLGNPGPQYADTRHNAGVWLVEMLAKQAGASFSEQKKFYGLSARVSFQAQELHLLLPTTFMNRSGQAIRALAQFYKIPPEAILVAHDELDLAPGIARIKLDGGHGGHNGLRDTMAHLGTSRFYRLRIGIGHPGQRNQVVDYVLHNPAKAEREQIDAALTKTLAVLPDLIIGDEQKAMRLLHG
jgi:PTH1 family peptidyl-tRNA hydrolase